MLAVLYLLFNEGYAATSGDELVRAGLCAEAIRLTRTVADLMPDEPEALGLLALDVAPGVSASGSRRRAGDLVPLEHQDRSALGPGGHRRGSGASRIGPCGGAGPAPTKYRQPSPPATPTPGAPRRPTGERSRPSTPGWPSWPRLQWCTSTTPWRWPWRTVQLLGCPGRGAGRVRGAQRLPPAGRHQGRSAAAAGPLRRGGRGLPAGDRPVR